MLDIGCVGPTPFQFWEPLLSTNDNFHLTGIDVQGIEQAREIVIKRNWQNRVDLLEGSGYTLTKLFAKESFDVVVATQVLEHVARLPEFINQVAVILKSSGNAFFTLDSAHWRARYDLRYPVRLAKNVIKKGWSLLGNESHYDLPWSDYEVINACQQAGLQSIECRYYNLQPIKLLHNRIILPKQRNELMKFWFDFEEWLNESEQVRTMGRHLFLGIYIHIRKSEIS